MRDQPADVDEVAAASRWTSDGPRSIALVRSTYRHVDDGVPLWLQGRQFVTADGPIDVSI